MIRVAIADDHVMLRKGVAEMLSKTDGLMVVAEAGNGVELLNKMQQSTPLPDVCILDINMPEMNGYETAKAIKEKWPTIRILALSMYDTELNVIKMLRAGAHGYILKDSDPEELKIAIFSVCKNGYYHSDIVTGKMLHVLQEEDGRFNVEISEKEMQFLKYSSTEMTYKEIANEMKLSARTIDGYRESLFKKFNTTSRTGLAIYAIRAGLVHV